MSKRKTGWLRWRHRFEYLIFRLVVCLLQILTPRQAVQLARAAAFLVCRGFPRRLTRYEVARDNLQRAFPGRYSDAELDALIFEMWVHLFRMIVEIAQLPRKLRLTNFRRVFSFSNREPVVRAACSDRPMILVSGHYGNWEMSLAVFGMFGFRMHAVARPLDNPYLHRWFEEFRQRTGHELIAKKGAFRRMADVLETGGTVAVLGDQDAGPRGTFVEFFGRPASTFPTLARLAVEFDACLCVGYSRRLPDDFDDCHWVRYELGCEEVIDPR
ncbi:MAG TPA: lipid A biosynthesis acyltransferase, partial [Planctomycetaceae bacterium]|nr:lipid A biosynthesis acyltransferase [Planctomycetaceae bacterium]